MFRVNSSRKRAKVYGIYPTRARSRSTEPAWRTSRISRSISCTRLTCFPHIPSQQLVIAFLREIHRVLRPGGLARLQFNGSAGSQAFDQWTGARFTLHELMDFAQAHDFQVLALDGVSTPSMWTTWRKQPAGWSAGLEKEVAAWGDTLPVTIHKITNASSFEPVAPCRGRFAAISIRAGNLPPDAGLNHLRATIGSSLGTITSISAPDREGWQRIRVDLPELEATGLLPVQLFWLDRPISPPATLRVIPPGPPIPRVATAPRRIENRIVRLTLEEIARPWEIEIWVEGQPVEDLEKTCSDPRPQRYQVNFRLPEQVGPGLHHLNINIGHRKLPPVPIEVVVLKGRRVVAQHRLAHDLDRRETLLQEVVVKFLE